MKKGGTNMNAREEQLIGALEGIATGDATSTVAGAVAIAKEALVRWQRDPDISITITRDQARSILAFFKTEWVPLDYRAEIREVLQQIEDVLSE